MIVLPLINTAKLGFIRRIGLIRISKLRNSGTVKFTENNICISMNKNIIHYYFEDINRMTIHGNLYKEYLPTLLEPGVHSDKILQSGLTKVILEFEKNKIEINFLITTKREFQSLVSILKKWYLSKRFKIKEYDHTKSPMLLLNPYNSYEVLQVIKNELGVKLYK